MLAFNKRNTSKWSSLSLILIQTLLSAQTLNTPWVHIQEGKGNFIQDPKKLEGFFFFFFFMFLWSSHLIPWKIYGPLKPTKTNPAKGVFSVFKYRTSWSKNKPMKWWIREEQQANAWICFLHEVVSLDRSGFPLTSLVFFCMCIPHARTACPPFNQTLSKISGPTQIPILWRGLHKLCLPVIIFTFVSAW